MPYGDLQTFLPRAEGQVLDVERARAEGASRANYLSQMDQFSEQLEESARQFDLSQSLAERQFEWSSGFEETRLAEETRIADEKMELDRYLGELQGGYWESQIELGKMEIGIREKELEMKGKEQDYLQGYYSSQLEMEKSRFGVESQLMIKELYPVVDAWQPYSFGTGRGKYDKNLKPRQAFARAHGIKLYG